VLTSCCTVGYRFDPSAFLKETFCSSHPGNISVLKKCSFGHPAVRIRVKGTLKRKK
jgi:hypothetical protein